MCLCKVVVLRYHCLKKDTWTPPRQYSISSTALPASCPLLCLAHIASLRTQYAAKHWHSGTAATASRVLWAVLPEMQPFLHACCTLYLRAMLACFLFRAVLVLLIGRGRDLEESLLAFTRIRYTCSSTDVTLYLYHLELKRSETISHPISGTQTCDDSPVLSALAQRSPLSPPC